MSEQPEPSRAAEIIRVVKQNLLDGRLAFEIATRFLEARKTGRLPSDQWVYYGVSVFCWRDALLSLARLLDQSCKAVSLHYLLNYSEQNPSEYPLATPQGVRQVVGRQRAVLAPNPLWE